MQAVFVHHSQIWRTDVRYGSKADINSARGADIRPDFHWDKPGLLTKGF